MMTASVSAVRARGRYCPASASSGQTVPAARSGTTTTKVRARSRQSRPGYSRTGPSRSRQLRAVRRNAVRRRARRKRGSAPRAAHSPARPRPATSRTPRAHSRPSRRCSHRSHANRIAAQARTPIRTADPDMPAGRARARTTHGPRRTALSPSGHAPRFASNRRSSFSFWICRAVRSRAPTKPPSAMLSHSISFSSNCSLRSLSSAGTPSVQYDL